MKTNDHNKQLYRDMLEAPDKYSDQEIETMMDDLDQMPDVDEAWQQFAQQHISSVRLMHTWRKVAAILIGILAISGITIAAVRIVHQAQHEEQPAVVVEESQSAVSVSQVLPADTIVRTEDIAAYHHLDMDLQNEQVSQLRFYFVWNRDDNLQEVIEKLNMFEQVNLAVEDGKLIIR